MSYLLRAMQKSQAERAAAGTAGCGMVAYLPHVPQTPLRRYRARAPWLVLSGILLALIVISLPIFFLR